MEYRPLGRTGINVSQICLGAMMFGAFGNSDHDDAVQIIHKARPAPRWLGSASIGRPNFTASTTLSRRPPVSALPRISSDSPAE